MEISAKDIAALRTLTGAGILDCRRALQETGGDQEAAALWLRENGLVSAAKRSDRENTEGAVAVVVTGEHPVGAIVELKCETDFVAKSADFVSLVDKLAATLASDGEAALEALAPEVDELKVALKENIALGRVSRFEAAEGSVLGSYLHVQAERGVNAVLVELNGGTPDLAHDIAVHIAFARPEYLRREDVPAELVETERKTVEAIALNEGKPEAALEKIIDGRMTGWYKERVLLEQSYVRDEKKSISDFLGGATLVRFAQVAIGS
ncbi:MAG TPA: translation elongation factor Ts [Acidimicrobiales bacterium]|nr:translation elongation factor Ts [Acidimicrobiales bacterium]